MSTNYSSPIASFLGEQLHQPAKQDAIKGIINSRIHDFLQNRLSSSLPGLAPFIDQLLIEEFKKAMDSEIEGQLPSMLDEIVETASYDYNDSKLEAAVRNSELGKRYRSKIREEVIWWTLIGLLIGAGIGFLACSFLFEGRLFLDFSKI